MKICYIGSNGFLSTSFGLFFENAEVYGTSQPKKYQFKCFTDFDLTKINYQLEQFLDYDLIFLFSALSVQSGVKNDLNNILKINTFFPIELFDFLSKNKFKGILITFGSYFEIGCNNEIKAFNEEEIVNSKYKVPNDYCISKRLLTRYIDSIIPTIKYWHFILPTIYGANENSNRLIPYIINAIVTKKEINLTSGRQVREYIHVDEIPKIINEAVKTNLNSGIYNISGQERLSVRELVIKITDYYNYPIRNVKFGILDRRDTDMMYLALNANKLSNSLNFCIESSLIEKINDYLK